MTSTSFWARLNFPLFKAVCAFARVSLSSVLLEFSCALLPSSFAFARSSSSCASSNWPSKAFWIFLFNDLILSSLMITLIFSSSIPVSPTEATPSTASTPGETLSLISFEISDISLLSESIAVTSTGIISGFNFIIVGLPTLSGQYPLIISSFSRMSSAAESILASPSNSI